MLKVALFVFKFLIIKFFHHKNYKLKRNESKKIEEKIFETQSFHSHFLLWANVVNICLQPNRMNVYEFHFRKMENTNKNFQELTSLHCRPK